MTEDEWLETIRDRSDLAAQMAAEIPAMLQTGQLDLDLLRRLHAVLDQHIDACDELIEAAESDGAPAGAAASAEAVQEVFLDLHQSVGKRLIEMGDDLRARH